ARTVRYTECRIRRIQRAKLDPVHRETAHFFYYIAMLGISCDDNTAWRGFVVESHKHEITGMDERLHAVTGHGERQVSASRYFLGNVDRRCACYIPKLE